LFLVHHPPSPPPPPPPPPPRGHHQDDDWRRAGLRRGESGAGGGGRVAAAAAAAPRRHLNFFSLGDARALAFTAPHHFSTTRPHTHKHANTQLAKRRDSLCPAPRAKNKNHREFRLSSLLPPRLGVPLPSAPRAAPRVTPSSASVTRRLAPKRRAQASASRRFEGAPCLLLSSSTTAIAPAFLLTPSARPPSNCLRHETTPTPQQEPQPRQKGTSPLAAIQTRV
jgi:hypothetical protein